MKTSEIYSAYMYSYPHKTAYGKLENVDFFDYKGLLSDSSFYFHVPFCRSKCGYCNLFSVTGQSEEYMEQYIHAMEVQMKQYDVDVACFRSLTIGGGDPFVLTPRLMHRLLSLCTGINLNIETSPNETTPEKISILKDFSTNRISIGIQSFWDSELHTLKRSHSSDSAKRALHLLKSNDFSYINIDLIYGIPGQTLKTLESSLHEALDFEPDEIFIYPLYIRYGTGLIGKVINDNTYEMYMFSRDYLLSSGYFQISMRQFARKIPKGSGSCGFENMLAIGCGGRSYIGNLHFSHPYTVGKSKCLGIIDDFIKRHDKTKITHGIILNHDELKRRFIIKNLLYFIGVSVIEYERMFKMDLLLDYPIINKLISMGYAENSEDHIKLTPAGLSLSDYIGPMFISNEVKGKMAAWKNT